MSIADQTLALRARAQCAGLCPVALEVGPDEFGSLVDSSVRHLGMAGRYFGLDVRARAEPGLAVLALPNRKIGRYEVVCPTRFEAA